jgi:iron complex transport system ATP-binding protein
MTTIALQARHIEVVRDGRTILRVPELVIPAGNWTSIVGPNGAGKSTLLKVLAGLLPAHGDGSGQVQLFDHPLHSLRPRQRAQQLAWMGQNQSTDDLRVIDVVMLGRLPHQPWLAGPGELDHAKVEQALQLTQAWAWRERPFSHLSAGERQRVLLARLLAVDAQVLLMDEPLTNLDPPHQADWLHLVRQLVDQGKTVVSVLHELTLALQADELLVMAQGGVTHQGPSADPVTHRALARVFDERIAIHPLAGQWVALPKF